MSLYIDLQRRFIDNFNKVIYPDMETTRLAFEAYWEVLTASARTVYKKLQEDYGKGTGTVPNHIVLDYIRNMYECSDECAKEVLFVMTHHDKNNPNSVYITERQGGEIVL